MELNDRLVVAADPPKTIRSINSAARYVLGLAEALEGLNLIFKMNSAVRGNYELFREAKAAGCRVFADLKLVDIGDTMERDAFMLREYAPDIVTVKIDDDTIDGIARFKEVLGDRTEVLGVTVLTSSKQADSLDEVLRRAELAEPTGIDGLVSSGKEVGALRSRFGDRFTLNTPAIRPLWSVVEGDDQARITTPLQAIQAGADRTIVGRPITQAKDPHKAAERTLKEIGEALAA